MAKKKDMAHFHGQMEAHMKESLRTIIFMVRESTDGEMAEPMKENGLIIKCMVGEYSPGQMEESMRESILMTRKKVKELSHGLMEEFISAVGTMVNNMEWVNIPHQKENIRRESGKKARELDGSLRSKKKFEHLFSLTIQYFLETN
jgi:hypothetical protein